MLLLLIQIIDIKAMNYHFKDGTKKDNVRQQLLQLDQDLVEDKQRLDKLKLQAQFYEDKAKPPSFDKHSLADQIMNQLINDPYKPKYNANRPQSIPAPQHNSPPKEYLQKQAYKPQPPPERQNNLVNQREMQKMKLQNQKHQGLFPTSSDHNRVRSLGKNGAQIIPQKDKGNVNNNAYQQPTSPKKAKSPDFQRKYDPGFNPFVKDDAIQKQQKQQRNRQYLRQLQQQRLEQQRQKKARLKEQKQIKVQKYEPYKPSQKQQPTQKPLIMKKSDPNNRPPKIEPTIGNYSQFDKNLIKSKLIQLKSKFKKGKIIYEEYERQRNNLRKQYPGDIDELQEEQEAKREYSPPKNNIVEPSRSQEDIKIQSKQHFQEPKNEPMHFPIRNQSINYSQFMPSMVQPSYSPASGYTPNMMPQPMNPSMYTMLPPPAYFQGPPPGDYIDLFKKMFDFFSKQMKEVKQVKTQQTAQVQALQETLNKFMLMSTQQQQNFMTQNIPAIPNQFQRQFYSDAKQHRQYFDKEPNTRKKVMPSNESLAHIPFGESDNSEYYDKSLQGIASKIPLNQVNQRMTIREEEKSIKVSALDQFYNKKYKVKAFKKFNIIMNAHQSQLEIPSTSSYFRARNAKEELKNRFQEDLSQLKKMQKEKNMKKFEGKVISNSQYTTDKRVVKDVSSRLVGSQPFNQQISPIAKQSDPLLKNPYLKKHISTQDNMMTFNNRELKTNSPTGYTPISKKEILQQDEYLTQPKIREEISGAANLIYEYEERLNQPVKALNFIKQNNQLLSKYDKTQESKKEYTTIKEQSVREVNSKDYFVNNQISPVKAPEHQEQSLVTIRSDFESVKQSVKPKINTGKFIQFQNKEIEQELDNEEIIQTVESVEQSSTRLRKPPIAKRKSVGKKKETSITRSKGAYETNSHMQFSGTQQVDSSMGSLQKFDSNVYQSNYEESLDLVRPNRPKVELVLASRRDQSRQPRIQLNPPTINAPRAISPAKQAQSFQEQIKIPSSKSLAPQNKWKSLQQARKLAKQGRAKGDESNYRSVEQKFSQLESFMTKKGDQTQQQLSKLSVQNVYYDQKSRARSGKSKQKEPVKKQEKRNILKLLEELQDDKQQDYKQQFQSYREQSQQYQ